MFSEILVSDPRERKSNGFNLWKAVDMNHVSPQKASSSFSACHEVGGTFVDSETNRFNQNTGRQNLVKKGGHGHVEFFFDVRFLMYVVGGKNKH